MPEIQPEDLTFRGTPEEQEISERQVQKGIEAILRAIEKLDETPPEQVSEMIDETIGIKKDDPSNST